MLKYDVEQKWMKTLLKIFVWKTKMHTESKGIYASSCKYESSPFLFISGEWLGDDQVLYLLFSTAKRLKSETIYRVNIHIPYARHYNPLLIRNRSRILTIHKTRILRKKPLEKNIFGLQKVSKKDTNRGL